MSQDYFDDLREFTEDQIGCMRRGLNPSENYELASLRPIIDGIRQDLKIAFLFFEKRFKEFDSNFDPRKGIYPIALKNLIKRKEDLISDTESSEQLKIRNGTETDDEKKLRLEREECYEKECKQGFYNEEEPKFVRKSKEELSKLNPRERLSERIKEIEIQYRYMDPGSIVHSDCFYDEHRASLISIENEYLALKDKILSEPSIFRYSRFEVRRWMCEYNYIPKYNFLEKDRNPGSSDFPVFYFDENFVRADDFSIDMGLNRKGNNPLKQQRIITHSTNGKRRDSLAPVIEAAQRWCLNPHDWAEVWLILEEMARKKTAPFDGNFSVRGLAYQKDGKTTYFDREALRKRLNRQPPLTASSGL